MPVARSSTAAMCSTRPAPPPISRPAARKCPGDGGAREPGDHQALRPPARSRHSLAAMTPRCLFYLRALGKSREPASGCPPSKRSGKVPDTHSVGSICDHDFGVFTVTNIATENTDAVPPAHSVPRMPKAANQGLQRCRGPRVPLTCLAPLAAWQSLCTGHVDASLEISVALAFTNWDRASGGIADTSRPAAEHSHSSAPARPLVNRRKHFTLGQDLGTLGAHYENVR